VADLIKKYDKRLLAKLFYDRSKETPSHYKWVGPKDDPMKTQTSQAANGVVYYGTKFQNNFYFIALIHEGPDGKYLDLPSPDYAEK